MIIATRILRLVGDDGKVEVPVSLHAPVEDDRGWLCDYEIGWPRTPRRFHAYGDDATQALILGLQMVAIDLYTTEYHRAGLLIWDEEEAGYGYPMPAPIRDIDEGMDKRDKRPSLQHPPPL